MNRKILTLSINLLLSVFSVSFFYTINCIYESQPDDILTITISYLPIISLLIYAILLMPFGSKYFTSRVRRYSVSSALLLLLMLFAYLHLPYFISVFSIVGVNVISIIVLLMACHFHIKTVKEIGKIEQEAIDQFQDFISKNKDSFYDGSKMKWTRRIKSGIRIILFMGFSLWSPWIQYLLALLMMIVWFYELSLYIKQYQTDKKMMRIVIRYEVLEFLALMAVAILYVTQILTFVAFLFLAADFSYYWIKEEAYFMNWKQYNMEKTNSI